MSPENIQLIQITYNAQAVFKSRPNRFLGLVDLDSPEKATDVSVHIHDPGRLIDLLLPGVKVLLRKAASANRKTGWDVIAVQKDNHWILVHSGYHRSITECILRNREISPFGEINTIQPEVKYDHSRLDFLIEKAGGMKVWIEVKGCTLAENGIALFPDAPTKRGSRHLQTLIDLKQAGMEAAIIILVFRQEAKSFAPYQEIDPEFAALFYQAANTGVAVYPLHLTYEDGWIHYKKRLPLHSLIYTLRLKM